MGEVGTPPGAWSARIPAEDRWTREDTSRAAEGPTRQVAAHMPNCPQRGCSGCQPAVLEGQLCIPPAGGGYVYGTAVDAAFDLT